MKVAAGSRKPLVRPFWKREAQESTTGAYQCRLQVSSGGGARLRRSPRETPVSKSPLMDFNVRPEERHRQNRQPKKDCQHPESRRVLGICRYQHKATVVHRYSPDEISHHPKQDTGLARILQERILEVSGADESPDQQQNADKEDDLRGFAGRVSEHAVSLAMNSGDYWGGGGCVSKRWKGLLRGKRETSME